VAIFWHIPWPNAEVLESVRGSASWSMVFSRRFIGFHIQSHCNNFLETVDRAVEALTEWDRFAVNRQGHITRVRPFLSAWRFRENSHAVKESAIRAKNARPLRGDAHRGFALGVGVDRVDYTRESSNASAR